MSNKKLTQRNIIQTLGLLVISAVFFGLVFPPLVSASETILVALGLFGAGTVLSFWVVFILKESGIKW